VPSLPAGAAEPLPQNADALSVPDNAAISIYKQDEAGLPGTYLLRACVRQVSGANSCVTTPTRAVTINSACHVAALNPIPAVETDALELERNRTNREAPQRFVTPPVLNADLARRIDAFIARTESFFCPVGGCGLYRESGYRPVTYTEHLYGGSLALRAIGSPPVLQCVDYRDALMTHFNGEHRILSSRKHAGLMLNRPSTSNHDRQPGAAAVDLGGLSTLPGVNPRSRSVIDDIAGNVGLHRPCWSQLDYVHFELLATNCSRATVSARRRTSPVVPHEAADTTVPVRLLLTDPLGRRVGFDAATGASINEIGEQSVYTATSDLEEIAIDGAVEGEYVVTGVGAQSGGYTLTMSVEETEGDLLSSQEVSGEATAGVPIEPRIMPIAEPVPIPGLAVALNSGGFAAGDRLVLAASLTPLAVPRPVDAYIVVRLPTGQYLSLQLGGALVPGIVPIAQGFVPFDFAGTLAQYTFTGAEPLGTYTWYAALTEPGTLAFIGPVEQIAFTVVR
jgi:hypothetical protein